MELGFEQQIFENNKAAFRVCSEHFLFAVPFQPKIVILKSYTLDLQTVSLKEPSFDCIYVVSEASMIPLHAPTEHVSTTRQTM